MYFTKKFILNPSKSNIARSCVKISLTQKYIYHKCIVITVTAQTYIYISVVTAQANKKTRNADNLSQ